MCPRCNGSGGILGTLGKLTWLRCRQCGWEWALENGESQAQDLDDDTNCEARPNQLRLR
jgi:hypothetical protein